jgi:3-mercaptopyruvate sulfurtransferase SseA
MAESRKNSFPWLLVGIGVLLLVIGFGWIIFNQRPSPEITSIPASVEQVERVSLEDAKAAYDAGTAVFLDVRASSSYETSHIPTALSIPLNELPTRMGELDQGAWIIPY